jgi:hypothetical protein
MEIARLDARMAALEAMIEHLAKNEKQSTGSPANRNSFEVCPMIC